MTKDEALKLALEALESNKQTHYYCEDTWYSCPQHEDGCANDSVGDECNCGADKANAEIDKVMTAIREALAQPEQSQFNPDWDAMAVMVEEQQRMAKRIAELEAQQQEPVAWITKNGKGWLRWHRPEDNEKNKDSIPLYTTPPHRKPLTDEEVEKLVDDEDWYNDPNGFVRAIEAAHGIKE